ncbi:MAG: PAS domain S-box protein, partial [Desulfonatronovibrionaceae bacterium]
MVTEQIYKELFELSPDGVVLIDPETTLPMEFNRAAHENLGYSREEFSRLRINEYDAVESREETERRIKEIKKIRRLDFETMHRTREGELRQVLVTVKLVKFQEKDVFLSFFRDITETKKAESRAVELYERLDKISSQVPGVVYQFKLLPDGRSCFPYASKGLKKVYGVDPEDVHEDATKVFEVIHPDDREAVVASIENSARDLKLWKADYRVRHADGTEKWLMGSAVPQKDVDGSVLWYGFIMDITDQKKVQSKLEQKTRELEDFFDVSLDLLCISDFQGNFLKLNKSWENVLGYSIQELTSHNFMDFVHPDDVSMTRQTLMDLEKDRDVLNFVNRYKARDGSYRYIEWRSHPHGRLIYAAARDITERIETEKALRISEQRFKDVSEAAGEYIWETDVDGRYVFLTERIKDVLGRPLDEILGRSPFAFMPDQDSQRVMDFFLQKTEKGESFSGLEHRSLLPDGSIIWQRVTGLPVLDDAGRLRGYRGAAQDITEEKMVRQNLLESENKFRNLFEMAPIGIGLNDMQTGQWLDFNRSLLQSTGYSEEEFRRLSYWDLTPDEYSEKENEQLDQLRKTGYFGPYEKEYIRKDGRRYPVLLNGMLVKDYSGKEVIWCIVQDITQRKEYEQAILRKEQEIISMTNASLDALIVIDSRGRVTFWNRSAEKLFGYTENEALGQDIHELVAVNEDKENARKGIKEFAGTGQGMVVDNVMEFKARRKDGTLVDVERSVAAFALNNEWHAVGSVRDITDRKKARVAMEQAREAAESANRTKSEFLANMSHEIRTPMNAIIGLSRLALGLELSPRLRDYLTKIEGSSRMLLAIINDILDYSKIEAGRLELEHHEFDLDRILEQVSELFSHTCQDKGLQMLFRVSPEVPRKLLGDSLRLKQVLINLVGNAVKFTQEGEVEIGVSQIRQGDDQVHLLFSVHDTGIGMSREVQEKLFQAFSQADTSTTRKYGGTGLGLIISQRLVRLMGGDIQVRSSPGQGSVFSFKAVLGRGEAKELSFDSCVLGECRALVADSHEPTRSVLKEMLGSWRFMPEEAATVGEALKIIRHAAAAGKKFDIILLDWNLPDSGGLEVCRQVKEMEVRENIDPQPCIVLAPVNKQEELNAKAVDFEVDAFLSKPVTASSLLNVIMKTRFAGRPKTAGPGQSLTADESLRGLKILLVEDNEINQQVTREILERTGVDVHVAGNGLEAVKAVDEQQYDLVLMDIQMPVMDGFKAAEVIRQTHPALPIVAMTAAAMAEDREKCLAAGMNDHLAKPID